MRFRTFLPILSSLVFCVSIASASPKEDADKHFADGLRLYAEKDFKGASSALELAYNAQNKQTTLFAWAQAERLQGNCDKSKELLSKYIANGANPKQSEAAFKLMEDCTPAAVTPDDPVETTDPNVGTDTTVTGNDPIGDVTTSTVDSSPPWYRDWIGATLLSTGVVSTLFSAVSYSSALTSEEDAKKAGVSYDEFLKLRSKAEDARTFSVVLGVTGGLLVGAGVVYVLTGKSGDQEESENLSVQIDSTGAAFSFSGQF